MCFFVIHQKNEYEKNKHILLFKKWQEKPLDEISKQLHEMWYKHSTHDSKASFHIQWEILSIVNNSETFQYKISFWWDEIEEIFIIDIKTKETFAREEISIWDRNFDFYDSKNTQINTEMYICDDNIARIFVKKRVKKSMSKKLDLLLQIKPWDYVVHVDHWIWIFKQTIEKQLQVWIQKIIKKEYIELEYSWNDKLFVPITEVWRINRYVWVENPKLTWLSTKQWEKTMKKVHENVEEVAGELLEIYAQRELEKWYSFPSLPEEESKFFQSFEHNYTSDQYEIIQDIYTDMQSDKPMDRLVCWDVGFWKTEIAFAAIYKSIIAWKQAALISPLVVLAYEHFEKALKRFAPFAINIWVMTRFESKKSRDETMQKLKDGKIDLIVWTHRLLSEDIQFKDLWVLVIDEEHKFWVKDKDKIKKIRHNIDVLALSATPIPRSLNMALNGIKKMSMLTTAPIGRQSISTIVSRFDEKLIQEAWKREFERGGQLFFIHNKVSDIESLRDKLWLIFPKKKIIIAHGQLAGDQLEKRILAFKNKQYDILLATTVIENGIDFSNVNTIFINDAYNFWISQIHQLRWRVWRSDTQWFCYLLFNKDKIAEDAAKRLKTIVEYSHLWSWFELAVKDLEIRWWWDILGLKQSGQSTQVGMNLYLEMLEDKIEQLKRTGPNEVQQLENTSAKIQTSIELQIWAYIDEQFFDWELDKINFYRELESLDTLEDLDEIIKDFMIINQDIPIETQNFFSLMKIKLKAPEYKIISIKRAGINYQIDFDSSADIPDIKKFLQLDSQVKFWVVSGFRLRSSSKNFQNEEWFLKYMTDIFFGWASQKKKIRLKKKVDTI